VIFISFLKKERENSDHNIPVRLLQHDRHYLLRSIIFAFPSLFKPQVEPKRDFSFFSRKLSSSPDGLLYLLAIGAALNHTLGDVAAEIYRLQPISSMICFSSGRISGIGSRPNAIVPS